MIDSSVIGSTNAVRFVDTNVLLNAVSTAPDEQGKAEVAGSLLNEDDLALSVQGGELARYPCVSRSVSASGAIYPRMCAFAGHILCTPAKVFASAGFRLLRSSMPSGVGAQRY